MITTDQLTSSFDTLFNWIWEGGAESKTVMRQHTRGEWAANDMPFSPVGPFRCINGPGLVVYHRPQNTTGIGYMKSFDFRSTTDPKEFVELVENITRM